LAIFVRPDQVAPRNGAYAWTPASTSVNRGYTVNGLNQFTAVGANSYAYDLRGNLTADGSNTFGYSSENLLTSASVGHVSTSFTYDPLLRLYQGVAGATTSRLAYDGLDRIAEYNGSDALQRRYVFDGGGQPIIWYEGATVSSTTRRFLSSDERGSIVSVTDSSGALLGINSYDEYGLPGSGNLGAFGYTGQAWLPSVGVWYYKARIYSPTAGRFLQTDPIGYADSANLYNYVLGDPVNLIDPLGYDGGINIYEYADDDPVDHSDPSGTEAPCVTLNTGCGLDPNVNVSQALNRALDVLTVASLFVPGTEEFGAERLGAKLAAPLSQDFITAQKGGNMAGYLRQLTGMPRDKILQSMGTMRKTLAEHLEKIANPAKFMTRDDAANPKMVQRAIADWQQTVNRIEKQLKIAEDYLK
jgi:RHS repeat-associated protein